MSNDVHHYTYACLYWTVVLDYVINNYLEYLMRTFATLAATTILLIILVESGVVNALIMFIIIGAIPSTTFSLSPSAMLAIVVVIGWLIAVQATLIAIRISKQKQQHLTSYRQSPAIRRTHKPQGHSV